MNPMYSAPQDGTWILVIPIYPPNDPPDPWEPLVIVARWHLKEWRDERGCRLTVGCARRDIGGWMPLPEGIK